MAMKPIAYLDLDLEIAPGRAGAYPIAVLDSPAGQARDSLRLPFAPADLLQVVAALQDALAGDKDPLPGGFATPQALGQALFDALFPGDIRSRYHVSHNLAGEQGLRIRLRVRPPELAALPWELLYDPRQAEYLCLSGRTPVVRYPELPQPIQPLAVTAPLRILAMVAGTSDLPQLDVAEERGRIQDALGSLERVELVWLEGETCSGPCARAPGTSSTSSATAAWTPRPVRAISSWPAMTATAVP